MKQIRKQVVAVVLLICTLISNVSNVYAARVPTPYDRSIIRVQPMQNYEWYFRTVTAEGETKEVKLNNEDTMTDLTSTNETEYDWFFESLNKMDSYRLSKVGNKLYLDYTSTKMATEPFQRGEGMMFARTVATELQLTYDIKETVEEEQTVYHWILHYTIFSPLFDLSTLYILNSAGELVSVNDNTAEYEINNINFTEQLITFDYTSRNYVLSDDSRTTVDYDVDTEANKIRIVLTPHLQKVVSSSVEDRYSNSESPLTIDSELTRGTVYWIPLKV